MRIAICDDDETQLNNTNQALEAVYKSLDLLTDIYRDGESLLRAAARAHYDLVILDIEMPGLNGIETARRLRALAEKTAIVFLTSHVEYALEGYEVNALRYLTKPVSKQKLLEIINWLLEREKRDKRLLWRTKDGMVSVSISDILYMEAQNQNIRVVTVHGAYWNRYNLSDYEKECRQYGFFRIHRGYLVNLAHVSRVTGRDAVMEDGCHLPVSRAKEKAFKEALYSFIREEAI